MRPQRKTMDTPPERTGPTVERIPSNSQRAYAMAFRRWLIPQANSTWVRHAVR